MRDGIMRTSFFKQIKVLVADSSDGSVTEFIGRYGSAKSIPNSLVHFLSLRYSAFSHESRYVWTWWEARWKTVTNSFNPIQATGASTSQAALFPTGKSGSTRPDR